MEDDTRMGITDPGESPQRSPQDTAREFEALWAQSELRAKFRRGLDRDGLEELKSRSSRLRRMAQQAAVTER